ncbi:NADH dehydrogenase [ubiquinone] 1 alpha subcomplex subunit 3-like [Physeter macrocephalus]|uniref:NADH dehydrogenase [ubiquinone] 1 alpha subcomplex subunit 3 n=1 Tax=Physeter macrocephalus TaxID=9755 RepID=A0A9W2WV85_PHYMC|nr:NADH dehydrogenase [ubiquinone] 1 alpha subcomplex subunit 3-like [Physeter catodon]
MTNKIDDQLLGIVLLAAVVPKEMLPEVVRFDICESAWKAAHILGLPPTYSSDLNWGSQGNCKAPSFLKNAWAKELVLVVSSTIGGLIIILPTMSPYTEYAIMINQASPYNHTVLLLDNGNIPNGSSHPQDPQGPSLEWLKKL